MSKSFNGFIIEVRYKCIISILEHIKKLVMRRYVEGRKFLASRFKTKFSPKIWEKIEENRDQCHRFVVDWNGGSGFVVCEIDNIDNRFVINLQRAKYTC